MSDWKPLIYSLIIIFTIGTIFTLVLAPLVDVESETQESWVSPFISTSNAIIELTSIPLVLVADLIQGIVGIVTSIGDFIRAPFSTLFGRGLPDEDDYTFAITVDGTGTHNGHTLDGVYSYVRSAKGVGQPMGLFWRLNITDGSTDVNNQIRVMYNKTEDVTSIELISSEHSWWRKLFNQAETIYEDLTPSNNPEDSINFNLVATSLNYNANAEGNFIIEGLEEHIEKTSNYSRELKRVIDEAKEVVALNLRIFGLLPSFIGLPILLILLMALLYGVIKILPFT